MGTRLGYDYARRIHIQEGDDNAEDTMVKGVDVTPLFNALLDEMVEIEGLQKPKSKLVGKKEDSQEVGRV